MTLTTNLFENVKCLESPEGNVWKYVFHMKDAIAEAVLYKYNSFEDRTVLCISVQSGCPVGCTFCGTGEKFIKNLSPEEIVGQADYILTDKNVNTSNIKKFQIMFMSMGEPFLNYTNLKKAIHLLDKTYPTARLLVSTIGPKQYESFNDFIQLSKTYKNIGLQFSIHKSTKDERDVLIPYKNKLSFSEIQTYAIDWWHETGRKVYCNYCIDGTNNTQQDFENLKMMFPSNVFCFTFSVVCSADETMKDAGYRNLDIIREFEQKFIKEGYDTRIFDPAGQDSIGGGCGQLWHVQKYLKEKGK